jgi:argininosuccinate lyase
MQETQEPVFAATLEAHKMLYVLTRFSQALQFRTDRMKAACETGFLNAMAAATYLVHKGLPFRTAHEKLGNAVRYCLDKKCELGDLSLEELHQFGEEFAEDFFQAVTLEATLDCHDVLGGTARARVRAAVPEAKNRLDALVARTHDLVARYAPAPAPEVPHAGA